MNQTSTRRAAALEFSLALALLATSSVAMAQETAAKSASPDARSAANEVRAEAPKKPADAPAATPLPTKPTGGDMTRAEDEYAYEVEAEPLQVGDATQGLLAWQRSGEIASPTPRPIAGSVANRSYERYLKSFEFPIPERMSSIVKTTSDNGSGK